MLKIKNNSYLYTVISKISGFDKILSELNNLIDIKDNEKSSIEYKISQELKKLNYNFSYIGTQYLLEISVLLYNNGYTSKIKLKKDVYPILAKKYKKSINNIKTNIIKSTERLIDSKQNSIDTVTPKQAINAILNKILINF